MKLWIGERALADLQDSGDCPKVVRSVAKRHLYSRTWEYLLELDPGTAARMYRGACDLARTGDKQTRRAMLRLIPKLEKIVTVGDLQKGHGL